MTHASSVNGSGAVHDVNGSRPRPADAVPLLRGIADAAAVFTTELDMLAKRYPARGGLGADPLAVLLDQAAAAANDLHSSAVAAAEVVIHRTDATGTG